MADTRRVTGRGFAGEPTHSNASAAFCQSPSEYRPSLISLPADGTEAFSPVLDSDRVYKITTEGTCGVLKCRAFLRCPVGHADALYRTDECGAFSEPQEWLCIDDESLATLIRAGAAKICEQDREAHRYSFQINGAGRKVGISFRPFELFTRKMVGTEPSSLTIKVDPLPAGTPLLECRPREEQATRKKNSVHVRLEGLRLQAHRLSHLLDSQFQEQYARQNFRTILGDSKKKWDREYDKFMGDEELKRLAEEKAPEVIQWLEARVKIVQLAERFAVTPPRESTVEDERASALGKRADRFDEQIALMELKGKKVAEVKSVSAALPLEEDEKEVLKTEAIRKILETGEGNEHGENGDTV